jgi:hypothetical protein
MMEPGRRRPGAAAPGATQAPTAPPPRLRTPRPPPRLRTPRHAALDDLLTGRPAERGRVIPHRRSVPLPPGNGAAGGTLLIDGLWQADWKIAKAKDQAVLEIWPFIRLSAADRDAVAAEAERLLGFAAPAGTAHDIRFAPVG